MIIVITAITAFICGYALVSACYSIDDIAQEVQEDPSLDEQAQMICDAEKLTIVSWRGGFVIKGDNGKGMDKDGTCKWPVRFYAKYCLHGTLYSAKRWLVRTHKHVLDGRAMSEPVFGYGVKTTPNRKKTFEELMSKMCELENQGKQEEADEIYNKIEELL